MRPRRILMVVAGILVPLVAIGVVGLVLESRRQQARAFDEARTFARSAAHLLEATLAGTREEVQEASRAPELGRALAARRVEEVERFVAGLEADPDLDAAAVLDPGGRPIAAAGPKELVQLVDGPGEAPLQLVAGGTGRAARALVRAPVLLDGEAVGELAVVEELDVVDEILVGAGGRVAPTLVIDPRGEVLIGPPEWLGRKLRLEGQDGGKVVISSDGEATSGIAETMAVAGHQGEVVTLVTRSLVGPAVPPTALALAVALAFLAAAATWFWALRLARTERSLERREREVAALRTVAVEAATAADRTSLARVAGRAAAEVAGAQAAWTACAEEGGQLLRCFPIPDLQPTPLDLASHPRLARVLTTGRREEGPTEDAPAGSRLREVWTPVASHGRVIGALGLAGPGLQVEGRSIERLIDGIAATLASGLESHDALAQLQRQREMLTRVVESSPDGLVALDPADRVVLDNPAVREFYRAEGSLVGLSVDQLAERLAERGGRAEYDFEVRDSLARARAGVPTRGTLRLITGEVTRHGESLMVPLRFPGGESGVLVSIRDVTERTELAEVRRLHRRVRSVAQVAERRAALLESVLAASEVGFVFVDREGIIGYVTELAASLLGLEILPRGLPVRVLEDMIAARTDDPVHGLLERGGPLTLAGEPRRFVAFHVSEVRGDGGGSIGQLISIRDETSQRELEIAREEFLGVAAHELKNPLAALRLQAEMGLRGEAEKRAESLSKIGRKARELTELVERLLDVTRADLGRLVTELTRVDVADLARDVAEGFEGGPAQLRLAAEAPAETIGDPTRIRQVLANLLSNAVRYAGNRGPIDVEVRREEAEIRVSVRDRGPGISPAERSRIFERFGQGRTGKRGPGLGIGLYLARKIAEEHGGRLELETEVGKGSTFTLVLPVQPAAHPVLGEGRA